MAFHPFFPNNLITGGFIDVAEWRTQAAALNRHRFGSTRPHGVASGPYMQLPFTAAYTPREDGGDMADTLYPVLRG